MIFQKITHEIIEKLCNEFNKDVNKKILNDGIINPLVSYITNSIITEFYPFILSGITIFILTFILVLVILIVILIKN